MLIEIAAWTGSQEANKIFDMNCKTDESSSSSYAHKLANGVSRKPSISRHARGANAFTNKRCEDDYLFALETLEVYANFSEIRSVWWYRHYNRIFRMIYSYTVRYVNRFDVILNYLTCWSLCRPTIHLAIISSTATHCVSIEGLVEFFIITNYWGWQSKKYILLNYASKTFIPTKIDN